MRLDRRRNTEQGWGWLAGHCSARQTLQSSPASFLFSCPRTIQPTCQPGPPLVSLPAPRPLIGPGRAPPGGARAQWRQRTAQPAPAYLWSGGAALGSQW